MTLFRREARALPVDRFRQLGLEQVIASGEPVIVKGLVADWPVVKVGTNSMREAADYLKRFDAGRPVVSYRASADQGGRFSYDDDVTGMNFEARRVELAPALEEILSSIGDPTQPSVYIGSTDIDTYLPDFRTENVLPFTLPASAAPNPLVSIWIGNRTTASAHWDVSNNIACCVVGRRRFTLFPPDQVANLYPGPLEPTPGGQVVSMVDFRSPDFAKYPDFAKAVETALVAELEPGDAVIYPAMWWHHVEALEDFNVLVNYWWNAVPSYVDTPMNTLLHGLLSLRDRPPAEKEAWRALFDYYVFGPPERAGAHLPPQARGPLGPMDEGAARRLRRMLLAKLNR